VDQFVDLLGVAAVNSAWSYPRMSWRVLNEIYNAKGIKRRLVALTGVEGV